MPLVSRGFIFSIISDRHTSIYGYSLFFFWGLIRFAEEGELYFRASPDAIFRFSFRSETLIMLSQRNPPSLPTPNSTPTVTSLMAWHGGMLRCADDFMILLLR